MPLSSVQPNAYYALLADKAESVTALLAPFSLPPPTIYPSPPIGYRMRAEFRMWHDGDDINFVMFRRDDPKTPVAIREFPIADKRIQNLMPALLAELKQNDILRHKLFQVEFLATLAGDLLVTLIYHRKLDQEWEDTAQTLVTKLKSNLRALSLIGRSRRQKLVIGRDYVEEVLPISGTEFHYRQYEQAFSQPNGQVNIRMIEWASAQASTLRGDLLELYCGNGNFTLPLSRHFDSVIATELAKSSVRAARANLLSNHIENVHLVRLSAEEVTQAMRAERLFRRLSELPKPLDQFNLCNLFVDPPRAGLDEKTIAMASHFPTIIYISCNPQTLANNLQTLCKTHRIMQFALFDQFPYTDHMECGVLLQQEPETGQRLTANTE